jgi:hypothetical protein
VTSIQTEEEWEAVPDPPNWHDDEFYLSLCDEVLALCRACSAGTVTMTPEIRTALRQAQQLLAVDAKGVDQITALMMRVAAANADSVLGDLHRAHPAQ